jgi:hypothetical protein
VATLTLKKPKPIGETPLQDIDLKFVVMRQSRSTKSFRFSCYHESFDVALEEATRLAKKYQTERFLVLQVHGFADWRP